MATDQASRGLSVGELTIVDTDSHLVPDADDLLPYMDERSAGRRMIERADDVSTDVMTKTRASPKFPNDGAYEGGRAGHDPNDPDGKLGFMDEFGVDYTVLTGRSGIATINHDQTAVEWARAYNDWLSDVALDADERLYATMAVASQRPDEAAEEIDRMAGEPDVVGVQLPAAGLVPPAGHWLYDPIYRAAEDHGLPVVLHSHDVQAAATFPVQRYWAETFTESHAFTFPVESMWHLISMVCNGVPERFPDLDFVLQEPGFEWLPWMMWRLDDHYLQNSEDLPGLRRFPSEYIRDQYHVTTQPLGHARDDQHMGWAMEMAGAGETLLFATDHPHPDFDTPAEVLGPARTQLDADAIRGVMGETAIDVFGL